MKIASTSILLFVINISFISCTKPVEKFDFGFESQEIVSEDSRGWFQWGLHQASIEKDTKSGEKYGKVSSLGTEVSLGSIAYKVPANYKGGELLLWVV